MTRDELNKVGKGTTLHFTYWPGRPSVPVTNLGNPNGRVEMPDGSELHAFADELSLQPRAGLEED